MKDNIKIRICVAIDEQIHFKAQEYADKIGSNLSRLITDCLVERMIKKPAKSIIEKIDEVNSDGEKA